MNYSKLILINNQNIKILFYLLKLFINLFGFKKKSILSSNNLILGHWTYIIWIRVIIYWGIKQITENMSFLWILIIKLNLVDL